jgi:hypothetical protein
MLKNLKIAVISGLRLDQGKTSIVDNLVVPRLLNPTRFEIEVASTGSAKPGITRIAAAQMSQLREALMDLSPEDSLVVDVGGSQYSEFLVSLSQFRSTSAELTRIVYVMKYGGIKQSDAIGALIKLFEMGVEPQKVSVVFNGAPYLVGLEELRKNLASEFSKVFESSSKFGFHICPTPIVYADALFRTVFHSPDWTIDSLANAPDFRENIRSLKKNGQEVPTALFVLEAAQENARSFGKANLDAVWQEIMSVTQGDE